MDERDWLAARFEGIALTPAGGAYRMLGGLPEADDAVRDAWLRLGRSGASGTENLSGWPTTIVARICLNLLRSRKLRRVVAQQPFCRGGIELAVRPRSARRAAEKLTPLNQCSVRRAAQRSAPTRRGLRSTAVRIRAAAGTDGPATRAASARRVW